MGANQVCIISFIQENTLVRYRLIAIIIYLYNSNNQAIPSREFFKGLIIGALFPFHYPVPGIGVLAT